MDIHTATPSPSFFRVINSLILHLLWPIRAASRAKGHEKSFFLILFCVIGLASALVMILSDLRISLVGEFSSLALLIAVIVYVFFWWRTFLLLTKV